MRTLEDDQVINSIITASGSFNRGIEEIQAVPNSYFAKHEFYTPAGEREKLPTEAILRKFQERTGIESRIWAAPNKVASDLGAEALRNTGHISRGGRIDLIIGATNYFDVDSTGFIDTVPGFATRVLHKSGYQWHESKRVKSFDIVNGCPGWLEGMIQAHRAILTGDANSVAVVAGETLSRISDPHDKNTPIFSDGAGAVILERRETGFQGIQEGTPGVREGIISHASRTIGTYKPKKGIGSKDAKDLKDNAEENCSNYISMSSSYKPGHTPDRKYIHMIGNAVADIARHHVPELVRELLEGAKLKTDDVSLFLLHQANKKLDVDMALDAGVPEKDIDRKVPIIIESFGNSSVATIPIMYDMIARKQLVSPLGHRFIFRPESHVVFASVGASMEVNALLYRVPRE